MTSFLSFLWTDEEILYTSAAREECAKQTINLCPGVAHNQSAEKHTHQLAVGDLEACKPSIVCSDAQLRAVIEEQVKVGLNAYHALQRMHASLINMTVFASAARTLDKDFKPFLPEHCVLL
jgi:hypothetical protein